MCPIFTDLFLNIFSDIYLWLVHFENMYFYASFTLTISQNHEQKPFSFVLLQRKSPLEFYLSERRVRNRAANIESESKNERRDCETWKERWRGEWARLKWMLWLIATVVNILPYRGQSCHAFANTALCLFNSPLTSVFSLVPTLISLPHPSTSFLGSHSVSVPYPHEVKVPGFCSNYRSLSSTKALTRFDWMKGPLELKRAPATDGVCVKGFIASWEGD